MCIKMDNNVHVYRLFQKHRNKSFVTLLGHQEIKGYHLITLMLTWFLHF